MHDQSTPAPLTPRNGVVALTGYGIRVAVERGHLIVSDGIGRERRNGRFSRVARDIKRLVVIGHTGTISFDALRWLHDIGAAFVQIDADGNVIVASGPAGLDDARLRRAQALATFNETGIALTRILIREKLTGQAAVMHRLPGTDDARDSIQRAIDALTQTETPESLRMIEADAARFYWQAWENIPLRFGKQDATHIPAHWQTFGSRGSLVSNGPRNATNPANAMLNYLYAIVEAETRIAALIVGLDPGMGMLHADQRARDSLACDLMEVVRPQVDAFVLDMLTTRTFRARDFFENRQGVCRVLPPLTKALAETAPRWTAAIAPIAEQVAHTLFTGDTSAQNIRRTRAAASGKSTGRVPKRAVLPTPLTQTNRSTGRDGVRRKPNPVSRASAPALPPTCQICGGPLPDADRRYCDGCLPEWKREEAITAYRDAGVSALARRRAMGDDPAHGGEAGRKKGKSNQQHMQEVAEWEREHPDKSDPDVFAREILPLLRDVPLGAMMRATGLSLRYCSLIRRGLSVPHPRHWVSLKEVISSSLRC